jgi:AcrR family transcriptional regulator
MSKNKKSARTREEILDAAWTLIPRKGADVSLAEIAKEAGGTRQSVYVHFGSRGGLLMALVQRADERFAIWEAMEKALGEAETAAKLRAVLAAWFAFVPQIAPVARELIRLKPQDEAVAAAWNDRMDELYGVFRDLAAALEAEGRLAPSWQAGKAADYLWAASSVQVWDLLTGERGWRGEETAQRLTEAHLAVLLA